MTTPTHCVIAAKSAKGNAWTKYDRLHQEVLERRAGDLGCHAPVCHH